jgi:hypothetical protein
MNSFRVVRGEISDISSTGGWDFKKEIASPRSIDCTM